MYRRKNEGNHQVFYLFSIVPSIAIIAGLISLAAVIGLPYSWFGLSVLGSVTYELMASNMALSSLGLNLSNATGYAFGLVMWAMCLGITIGNVFNIFMCKKYIWVSRSWAAAIRNGACFHSLSL